MLFAPFVAINHHGQSILLGADLISSEDTSTFVWFFEAWLEGMNGWAPKAIITDQDRAMENAIANVFPNNRHRKDLKRRYTLVKSSYDDLRINADAGRYDLVVKRCLRLAMRVSHSDDHVNAFLHHLDEFEHKFAGLQLESGSIKMKENMVADEGKKILSSHAVQEKGRLPTRRRVPPVEKAAMKRKKRHVLYFV
ncbi:uncharacterized protein LOC121238170 [Juglans microcarpa x Juglans regia]|uniref:uncharacterized protein LOC121238170 n=1 Tax=Juglans microcarpa x Juglans regia TaxID=2249226 RepID=UPI001B7DDAA4|nr:uncharacterized protein LOC121238170 [Juglans microcarpa x Juglans regia]